ncbi:hypothetical protein Tco_0054668, partial [Tanacetum coccineum]
ILPDKEDFAATNIESSKGLRRETGAGSQVSHGVNGDTRHRLEADAQVLDSSGDAPVSHVTESKDIDFCVDEPRDPDHEEDDYIGSDEDDENLVNGYCHDAQVEGTSGDEFQREILPPAPGPYYMSYPNDKGSSDSTPPYTREEWDGVHTVDIGLLNKEYKGLKTKQKREFSGLIRSSLLIIRDQEEVIKIPRALQWKERKFMSPTVPSSLIGPARHHLYGSD